MLTHCNASAKIFAPQMPPTAKCRPRRGGRPPSSPFPPSLHQCLLGESNFSREEGVLHPYVVAGSAFNLRARTQVLSQFALPRLDVWWQQCRQSWLVRWTFFLLAAGAPYSLYIQVSQQSVAGCRGYGKDRRRCSQVQVIVWVACDYDMARAFSSCSQPGRCTAQTARLFRHCSLCSINSSLYYWSFWLSPATSSSSSTLFAK